MPRQSTSPSDYPQAVLQQIGKLAQHIVIARKRRGETQAQWAKKLGVSQPTMARIERGDPAVAMASYVMCLWLINQAEGLADLIAPLNDHAALEREVSRVHGKRKPLTSPDAVSAYARAPSVAEPAPAVRPEAPAAWASNTVNPLDWALEGLRMAGAKGWANENAVGLAALLHKPKGTPQ